MYGSCGLGRVCGVEGIAGALTWRGLGPEGWTYCVFSRPEGRDLLRVHGGGCIWCFVADANVGSDSGTCSDSDVTAVVVAASAASASAARRRRRRRRS